jgi:hypothetical protein
MIERILTYKVKTEYTCQDTKTADDRMIVDAVKIMGMLADMPHVKAVTLVKETRQEEKR